MAENKKLVAAILTLVFALSCLPADTLATRSKFGAVVRVSVDGVEAGSIPAFDYEYENNLCISLKGLAYCLRGTGKEFCPVVGKNEIQITTGLPYEEQAAPWADGEAALESAASYSKHALYVDEAERKYYSFILRRDAGYDAFFPPLSLSLLLDLDIQVTEGRVEIDTSAPCALSLREAEASGCFQGVNAIVTGDADTGEIFYGFRADSAFPIASTSKLMTYFVFMDAVSRGDRSLTDTVTVSKEAAWLSDTPDRVIPMQEGLRVPVRELLYGMLIASSNECALALAEYTAGSEEAFVARMNDKAAELGLTGAKFYNCHGLPVYEDQVLPAKMQNYMSAREMFTLTAALLRDYPQITEITSVKKLHLDVLNKDLKNTNPMLYNMDNATGLKTGTTNRAGACLVTCVTAQKDGQSHNLITVLFGAESDLNRGLLSELGSRYAMRALEDASLREYGGATQTASGIPTDPELVVKRLLSLLKQQGHDTK